jgi:hypothetical protein
MTPKGVTCILSLASNLGKGTALLDHTLFDLDSDLDLDLEHGAWSSLSSQAVHDAQDGDGIDSVRPEPGNPLTDLQNLSQVRKDRIVGACGAVDAWAL